MKLFFDKENIFCRDVENTISKVKKCFFNFLFLIFCVAIIASCLFPFYWAIVSSLKPSANQFSIEFFPSIVTFSNYAEVFLDEAFVYSFGNSVIVATLTSILTLAVATLASYPLSRQFFKGRRRILMTFLGVTTIPHVAVLSGLFELIRFLDIYNEKSALILSYMILTIPFAVWVITNFMKSVPKELEEAAIMDGANQLTILVKVFLPILKPSIVTTGLLSFIAAWNEFLFALTFSLDKQARTVPVAIALFSGAGQHELPWGVIMAASVIVTLPLIALIIIFQKKIISGLTMGAVKG